MCPPGKFKLREEIRRRAFQGNKVPASEATRKVFTAFDEGSSSGTSSRIDLLFVLQSVVTDTREISVLQISVEVLPWSANQSGRRSIEITYDFDNSITSSGFISILAARIGLLNYLIAFLNSSFELPDPPWKTRNTCYLSTSIPESIWVFHTGLSSFNPSFSLTYCWCLLRSSGWSFTFPGLYTP